MLAWGWKGGKLPARHSVGVWLHRGQVTTVRAPTHQEQRSNLTSSLNQHSCFWTVWGRRTSFQFSTTGCQRLEDARERAKVYSRCLERRCFKSTGWKKTPVVHGLNFSAQKHTEQFFSWPINSHSPHNFKLSQQKHNILMYIYHLKWKY